jgi:hypothetical protein
MSGDEAEKEKDKGIDLFGGGTSTAIQLILLTKALKRLVDKVEKEQFDRAFLSDAVYVIGALFILLGISHPSVLEGMKSFFEDLLSGKEEGG